MTKQEYYDLLIRSANDGTFPSYGQLIKGFNQCLYRSNGHKCAVGVLIPDEKYNKEFEGVTINGLPQNLVFELLPDGMTRLDLILVQQCHDSNARNWSKYIFINELNTLSVFKDVEKCIPS